MEAFNKTCAVWWEPGDVEVLGFAHDQREGREGKIGTTHILSTREDKQEWGESIDDMNEQREERGGVKGVRRQLREVMVAGWKR